MPQNAVALALSAGVASAAQALNATGGAWYTFVNNTDTEITIAFGVSSIGAPDATAYGIAANGGKEEWWCDGVTETHFRAFCAAARTLKYYRSS